MLVNRVGERIRLYQGNIQQYPFSSCVQRTHGVHQEPGNFILHVISEKLIYSLKPYLMKKRIDGFFYQILRICLEWPDLKYRLYTMHNHTNDIWGLREHDFKDFY